MSVNAGELSPQQDYLRRVVHPEKCDDERGGGAIDQFEMLRSDVEADGRLPDFE